MSLKESEKGLVGQDFSSPEGEERELSEASGAHTRPVADIFDAYVQADDGAQKLLQQMRALGMDVELIRRRINYDLHPARKPQDRPKKTRDMSLPEIVYFHFQEYFETLENCLRLMTEGHGDTVFFHKDPALRKAAVEIVRKITSGASLITPADLVSLRTAAEYRRALLKFNRKTG